MLRSFVLNELIALKSYVKGLLIVAIIVVALLIVAGVALAGLSWIGRQAPEFTAYESSMELNGASINKKERYFTGIDMIAKVGEVYRLTYDSGVALTQYKAHVNKLTGQNWYPCEDLANWPRREGVFECKDEWMRNDGKFSVVSIHHDNKVVEMEVRALIDSTGITVSIPDRHLEEYAAFDGWELFFSSMKPRSLFFTQNEYRPTPTEF